MRLAYVCADAGIPIESSKGAAVHVRALSRELALATGNLLLVTHTREPSLLENGGPAALWGTRQLPIQINTINGEMAGRPVPPLLRGKIETRLFENELVHGILSREHDRAQLDGVYERYSLWSTGASAFCREAKVPHILEVNAPLAWEESRYRDLPVPRAALYFERSLLCGADAVIAVSNEIAEHAASLGVVPDRISVQPNGYDHALFQNPPPLRRLALPQREEGDFWIAFVGSLKPWHGIEVLLDAFSELSRTNKLLLVGSGPMEKLVKARFPHDCKSGRIVMTGTCPHTEIPHALHFADIGVAPYPRLEHFYFSPLKVMEYAGAGLPIVASRTGQLKELFRHGKSCWLVEPGDAAALRAGIEHLASDPALRTRLASCAAEVVRPLSWDGNAAKVLALFGTRASLTAGTARGGT